MLPKKQRLRRHEVAFVFKKGSAQSHPFFFVKGLPDKKYPEALPRFAVMIPKHLYKTIVERNALRRKCYTYIEQNNAPWEQGTLYVVTMKGR